MLWAYSHKYSQEKGKCDYCDKKNKKNKNIALWGVQPVWSGKVQKYNEYKRDVATNARNERAKRKQEKKKNNNNTIITSK